MNQLNCEFEKYTVPNISPLLMVKRGIRYLKPRKYDEYTLEVFARRDDLSCDTIYIPYSSLSKKETMIEAFSKYGVLFDINYTSHLQRYINKEAREMQSQVTNFDICLSRELGWINIPDVDKRNFILNGVNVDDYYIEFYDKHFKFQNGSLEAQIEFIKEEVIPYPQTQLALTLGLASVISGYIEPYLNTRFFSNKCQWYIINW